MKKKVYTAFICLCCAVVSLFAQERVVELTNPNESCTSIAAGKLATTDGSVMTSQTCDGTSRTWMEVVPAQNWPDTAKLDLYWDLRHTESKNDRLGVKLKGSIPQVPYTFAYLNTGYPCMNEKQLAMGETLSWDVRSCVIPKACSILRICRGLLCNVAVRHARRSC